MVGLVLVSIAWFIMLSPAALGGPASYVTVIGHSMQPTLSGGDLAIVREQDHYVIGDVVAFRPSKHGGQGDAVVIHRIVDGSVEEGFVTQGDNNDGRDPWRLREREIVGEVWFSLPRAGHLLAALQAPLLLGGLASSIAVSAVLSGPEGTKNKRSAGEGRRLGGGGRRWLPSWRRLRRRIRALLPTAVLPAIVALLLGAGAGSAAHLPVSGGTLHVFRFSVQLEPVAAEVDVRPDTLNAQSEGQPVTGYIELPLPYHVANIDVSTIVLSIPGTSGVVPAQPAPVEIGDEDGDGVADLMVKFDRAAVIALAGGREGDITMMVSGRFGIGAEFQGTDTVRVIHSVTPNPDAAPPEATTVPPTASLSTPTATPTLTPEPTPTATPTFTPEPSPTDEALDFDALS